MLLKDCSCVKTGDLILLKDEKGNEVITLVISVNSEDNPRNLNFNSINTVDGLIKADSVIGVFNL